MTSTPANLHQITSSEHFKSILSEDLLRVSLLNFWAPWAAPCAQMNEVVLELAKKYPAILVLQIEAEEQSDITESFGVEAVPSFFILRASGHTLLGRISGADAAALTVSIATHAQPRTATGGFETDEQLNARLLSLMNQSKVVLFMKGSPDAPRCGFSKRTIALLREHGVDFTHFDILSDESVRAGLKVLNDWPTFPQLIIDGEFVGGLDIVTEMAENGELKDLLAR